jgi:thioesterase domain-containing protein
MTEFLDNLKSRLAESQKRFAAKQQQLAAINAEFQAVAQEFNAWQTLVNLEAKKELTAAREAEAPVIPALDTPSVVSTNPSTATSAPSAPTNAEVNKTDTVRELLRQHSAGMTPSEIWKQVKAQIPHRPYLYSILKRLKDKGDVSEKRGKYFFKFSPKPDEVKDVMH